MKIYTRVVLDIATGELLEAQSFDYDGPLALCDMFGGGQADAYQQAGQTQADAARYAADMQYKAANEANDLIKQMWQTGREDLAPWRLTGQMALDVYSGLLGLPSIYSTQMPTLPGQAGAPGAPGTPGAANALAQQAGATGQYPWITQTPGATEGYEGAAPGSTYSIDYTKLSPMMFQGQGGALYNMNPLLPNDLQGREAEFNEMMAKYARPGAQAMAGPMRDYFMRQWGMDPNQGYYYPVMQDGQPVFYDTQGNVLTPFQGAYGQPGGTPGGAGGQGANALSPYDISSPSQRINAEEWVKRTPGYQFQFQQGLNALDRSAASRGMLLSGAQAQAAQQYGQNYALGHYDNLMNRLASLAGIGQSSSGQTAQMGMSGAGQMGSNLMSAAAGAGQAHMAGAQALGSSYIGAAQAKQAGWNNAFNTLGTGFGLGYALLGPAIFSDKRLKKDIKKVNALRIAKDLKPVSYRYKWDDAKDKPRVGYLAQDVEKVLPQAVREGPGGYKMIDPVALNALAVMAIQEMRSN